MDHKLIHKNKVFNIASKRSLLQLSKLTIVVAGKEVRCCWKEVKCCWKEVKSLRFGFVLIVVARKLHVFCSVWMGFKMSLRRVGFTNLSFLGRIWGELISYKNAIIKLCSVLAALKLLITRHSFI